MVKKAASAKKRAASRCGAILPIERAIFSCFALVIDTEASNILCMFWTLMKLELSEYAAVLWATPSLKEAAETRPF